MPVKRRKDNKNHVLKEGESQRVDGSYMFRWTDRFQKRHCIYAPTLDQLRKKEKNLSLDRLNRPNKDETLLSINEVFVIWAQQKKGLKDNTFRNYQYMYNSFVHDTFGKLRISEIRKSDVRMFYSSLLNNNRMKIRTLDCIHTVLFQVFELAVEEGFISINPASNAMKELKATNNVDQDKRRALTIQEQQTFQWFLNTDLIAKRWEPIFTVLLFTGLRVGELTGLRWDDVDLENDLISVNHTLVYYDHRVEGKRCCFSINTPKTQNSNRLIPMTTEVKNAFLEEKKYQELSDSPKDIIIDGYTNFIFINRFGRPQNQTMLNKTLRTIMKRCNEKIMEEKLDKTFLPRFSCHSLRHTFATRLVEANVNMKAIQDILGHGDIRTTMNIYADATEDLKKKETAKLSSYLNEKLNSM